MLSKLSIFKKILIVMLAGIVSVGSACGFYLNSFLKDYNYKELSANNEDLGITTELNEDQSTEITNIALFGVDSRDTEKVGGNSDSIMIVSVDKLHNKIKVISIMRDSLVAVPEHGNRKITEAYGLGGAELAVRTLNENYNLNIREYATVNFEGMAEIIDAVGGVTVELTEAEVVNANGSISEQAYYAEVEPTFIAEAGEQLLNGMQAVAYARIRYVDNPNGSYGDFGRTDRQRYIMEQLFNKALQMDVLQYPSFAKALLPYLETSLSVSEILDLAGILSRDVGFVQTRVPLTEYVIDSGYTYDGASTVYYNLEYASKLIYAFIYDDIDPETYVAENTPVWTGIDDSGGSYSDDVTSQYKDSSESSTSSKSYSTKSSKNYTDDTSSNNYDNNYSTSSAEPQSQQVNPDEPESKTTTSVPTSTDTTSEETPQETINE